MINWQKHFKERLPWLLGISLFVVVFDQFTKNWIYHNLGRREAITVIEDFFHIVHVHNTGAAFGLFAGWEHSSILLTFISISAIICIVVYYFLMSSANKLTIIAFSLVVGGAAGNLIDRLRWGYVVDFIDWHYKNVYHWPAFNIADSAISTAMGLLAIELIRDYRHQRLVQKERV